MTTDATRRAVRDLLGHGLRGDLAHSRVGIELGQHLQTAITSDVGDGATVTDIVDALRDEVLDDMLAYARLLELYVLANVDELQFLSQTPKSDIEPFRPDVQPPPQRAIRSRRRR